MNILNITLPDLKHDGESFRTNGKLLLLSSGNRIRRQFKEKKENYHSIFYLIHTY